MTHYCIAVILLMRVNHDEKIDQKVRVKIIKVDPEKIGSVGMKQLEQDPWLKVRTL